MAEEFDLRSDYAAAMQEIGQQFDHIDRSLNFHTQQIAALDKKLNEQETVLYEHGALLKEQGRDMREVKMRIAMVENGVASLVMRQNSMDEKFDEMKLRQNNMSEKLDEVKLRQNSMSEKLDTLASDMKRVISLLSRAEEQ